MKANIKIIEKLKEESCTFHIHKVTSFILDMVSTLENSSDNYLIVNSTHKGKANGNLEALLSNREKVIVSRKYVSSLKKQLKKHSK